MGNAPGVDSISIGTRTIKKLRLRILSFVFLLFVVAFLDRVNIGFAALTMNKELAITSQRRDAGQLRELLKTNQYALVSVRNSGVEFAYSQTSAPEPVSALWRCFVTPQRPPLAKDEDYFPGGQNSAIIAAPGFRSAPNLRPQ